MMKRRAHTMILLSAIAAIGLAMAAAPAFADGAGPFGVGRPDGGLAPVGIGGWLLAQQALFNREIANALKQSADTGAMPIALIGLSALYGVLHAAGPGHGKAVISAYLFTSGETTRRGLLLSAASALLQAAVAIAIVAVLGYLMGATAKRMDATTLSLERVSFAAIAAVGAWLTWRKGKVFVGLLQGDEALAGQALYPGHVHHPGCGHLLVLRAAAGPAVPMGFTAEAASQPAIGRSSAIAAVLAGGLRPCTGALLILVFSMAQGMFAIGILATLAMAAGTAVTVGALAAVAVKAKGFAQYLTGSDRRGLTLALHALEVAVGVAVFVLGLALAVGSG